MATDDSCGNGFTVVSDPLIGPLADNGGPTLTHALYPDSPAIDTADSSVAPGTDQRSVSRPYGQGVDIGAFEFSLENGNNYPKLIINLSGDCHSGPNPNDPVVSTVSAGDTAYVFAQNAAGDWFQIGWKNKPPCWISSQVGKPTGDLTLIPVRSDWIVSSMIQRFLFYCTDKPVSFMGDFLFSKPVEGDFNMRFLDQVYPCNHPSQDLARLVCYGPQVQQNVPVIVELWNLAPAVLLGSWQTKTPDCSVGTGQVQNPSGQTKDCSAFSSKTPCESSGCTWVPIHDIGYCTP